MDKYQTALMAARALHESGFEAYIIGGAVRDLLLDRQPKDFDMATNATPDQVQSIPKLKKSVYKDTAQAYGVTRVKINSHAIEIATFRKDIEAHKGRKQTKVEFAQLEDDLARRDFTVNTLALDLLTGQVIDYEGGLDDLQNKIICFVGDPLVRIHEDPLRVLRAIRFRNLLGFNYDPDTYEAIITAVKSGVIETIAIDRLRDELSLMLIHRSRRASLEDLDGFGVLERVLPEVTGGKGVEQPPEFHAEGDVWAHQLLVMENLPAKPSHQLAWAALLHDIGKAKTQTLPKTKGDRIRFNRHYEVSADMARGILNRLRFSNRDVELITWTIYHHINIDDLPQMRISHQKAMLGHPAFADLLKLHKADAVASWHDGKSHPAPQFSEIEDIWRQYLEHPPEKRHPSLKKDLGIDGNWLLKKFGKELNLAQGPIVGEVLKNLEEIYLDKGVKELSFYQKRAKELIKSHLNQRTSGPD